MTTMNECNIQQKLSCLIKKTTNKQSSLSGLMLLNRIYIYIISLLYKTTHKKKTANKNTPFLPPKMTGSAPPFWWVHKDHHRVQASTERCQVRAEGDGWTASGAVSGAGFRRQSGEVQEVVQVFNMTSSTLQRTRNADVTPCW